MERLHLHTIQQLQHELADARERNGTFTDESHISQKDSKDVSQFGQNNGNQLDVNGGGAMNTNSGVLPNGNGDNAASFVSSDNASTQVDFLVVIVIFYCFLIWSLHNKCSSGSFHISNLVCGW